PMFSVAPSLATNATAFNPYLGPVSPGLLPAEILPSAPMLVAGSPGVAMPSAAAAAAQKLMRTDRLEVCREYQRGNCNRGENECRFAHPSESAMIDTNDNTVTVCMDYIKGRCSREKCKYFHPPAHLQAKIKAAQYQVNQAAVAQAAAMGIPQNVLPPLPKRPALEKTNGATGMFNTGFFQYQQALANMQLQQQAAFFPPGLGVHARHQRPVSAVNGHSRSQSVGLADRMSAWTHPHPRERQNGGLLISHDARSSAVYCVCSRNICYKCPLRCNSHSQPDQSELEEKYRPRPLAIMCIQHQQETQRSQQLDILHAEQCQDQHRIQLQYTISLQITKGAPCI
ncbi:hypothetical protein AB205_0150100, partial [Aquarana catesbeiana]